MYFVLSDHHNNQREGEHHYFTVKMRKLSDPPKVTETTSVILEAPPVFFQSLLSGSLIPGEAPLPQAQEAQLRGHHDPRHHAPNPSATTDWIRGTCLT